MAKAYVVLKKGFEYDDSFYNVQDGGEPIKVFDSALDAQLEADKLNIAAFRNKYIGSYLASESDDLIPDEGVFFGALGIEYCDWWPYEDIEIPVDWTDAQVQALMNMTSLRFYEVRETARG